MNSYRVGDWVAWTSSSHGETKQKVGEVLAVVPRGVHLTEALRTLLAAGHRFRCQSGSGGPRAEVSYLVLVQRGSARKPFLYWPLAGLLRLTKAS